jgi:uncharacterized protein YbjT (DUF2867 family)
MVDKRLIAVVGATGAQGGGLARAILDDPQGKFGCRALTRDPGRTPPERCATAGRTSYQPISTTRTAWRLHSTVRTARSA